MLLAKRVLKAIGIEQNATPKVGLALSGGGVRAVSHLGVMQALLDNGITFSMLSGTSAGAIAAVFVAQGYAPKEVLQFIKEVGLLKLLRPGYGSMGFVSILRAASLINQYIPHNSFSQLKIKTSVTAVDLGEAKLVYFIDGDLDMAVLASCCLPGIFSPITINGHMYVDGGVLDNFPVKPLGGNCDLIIGSCCNHLPEISTVKSMLNLVDRAALIAINASLEMNKTLCDVVIDPCDLGRFGVFETNAAEEIYAIGYEEGLKAIDGNKQLKAIAKGYNQE